MSQHRIDNLMEHAAAEAGPCLRLISLSVSLSILSLSPSSAFGDSSGDLDKRTPSVFAQYRVGYMTRKSGTLKTTDFGTEYIGAFGVWAGKSKALGIAVTSDQTRTHFSQFDASANSSWTDTTITYRYLWFSPSLIVGDMAIHIEKDGVPITNAVGITNGMGLDIRYPASQFVIASFGGKYLQPRKSYGNEDDEPVLTSRTDYQLEVAFYPSLEWMSLVAGYKARYYKIRSGDESVIETELGPNIGLSLQYEF